MVKFIEITNQNIYDKLCKIEEHVIYTNGRVKLNRWIASTAFAIALAGAGISLA